VQVVDFGEKYKVRREKKKKLSQSFTHTHRQGMLGQVWLCVCRWQSLWADVGCVPGACSERGPVCPWHSLLAALKWRGSEPYSAGAM
jgi:hypothetical protein